VSSSESKNGTPGWVLLVGASSGIGRSLAREFAAHGHNLVLAGRDTDDLERSATDLRVRFGVDAKPAFVDALDESKYQSFFDDCVAKAGGSLSGLVLAHGSLPLQEKVQQDLALVEETIDTNFTSFAALLTLGANELEKHNRGFICVISSVAGDRGRPSNYVYAAAKAGTTAFLQGLRARMHKVGVTVLTVKPGFVDTAMIWGKPGVFLVASPRRVSREIYDAVATGKSEIYTPGFWRYIMFMVKSIPEGMFKRMRS
jgi:decaprenylphospho-beta-D-erythro-pentofuranosid-2-ulose 2-reductase